MAWEKLTLSRPNSVFVPSAFSAAWIALVIAGAFLTNFDEPYLPFAIAGGFVFFLRCSPSRWEIYSWLLTSALFVKIIHLPQVPFWVLRIASAFAVLGFGALLLLGLRALWSEQADRENAVAVLLPCLILILFIFVSARVLSLATGLSPQTDDAWLYVFDGSLGFQPSFWMGRIMYSSLALSRSAMLTYLSLPFAMALVCAWRVPLGARRISGHMLIVLLVAGCSGWILYNVVPGTGPIYAFGQSFPSNSVAYQDLSTLSLQKMSIAPSIPRNAMPSLHMAWVILLWWNSRGLPRALRAGLLLYVALTVVATMGGGQHYLVDLIVSLPFALAVQAAAFYSTPNKWRIPAMISGVGCTAAWLALIRFGLPWVLKSPALPWTLILGTASMTFWMESKLCGQKSTGVATGKESIVVSRMAAASSK
ncbi:MAG: hypothetical protein JWQ87_1824 [Candidatus Sulfotelmatobacter sp.]|nr:hypothetical protein [Candidatus Sulfotelmatobacter sp.]